MTDLVIAAHILPSPDLIKLEEDATKIASHARSANTVRAYRNDWAHFSDGVAIWTSGRSLPCPESSPSI